MTVARALTSLSFSVVVASLPLSWSGDTSNDTVRLDVQHSSKYSTAPISTTPTTTKYRRFPVFLCIDPEARRSAEIEATCAAALTLGEIPECADDEILLDPLFASTRADAGSPWSMWSLASGPECVGPAQLADDAARAFHEMKIQPAALHVQPPNGWTIVHFDTIVHTDDPDTAVQETSTELLGIPVTIRAVPSEFEWDFGDGESLATTDPGQPYPDQTLVHQYTALETYEITLTTAWTGQFQIAGASTWTDVPGTATTSSTSDPLDVVELKPRLVADPLGQY